MLIRLSDNILREFPDDLAALILADPSCGDDMPNFTAHEVNILVHGIFGTSYDFSMSYEENLNKIREIYLQMGQPSEKSYQAALKSVRAYNQEVPQEQIGSVSPEDVSIFFDSDAPKKIT